MFELPPQIVEREDRKTLNLLAYALKQRTVPERSWALGYDQADIGPVDDCHCLFRVDRAWRVSYTERGEWRELGRFPSSFDAVRFMWACLVPESSPYDYREPWERETGQQFSLTD